MKKILSFFALLTLGLSASAQMTDDEVKQYVDQGIEEGKSQAQMKRELAIKGVTRDQLLRLKEQYNAEKGTQATVNAAQLDVERVASPENLTVDDDKEDRQDNAHFRNEEKAANAMKIFGRDIFNNRNLTFEPSMNIATPQNYRLGPGDQVVIEVWGASQSKIAQKISPEGDINIPEIGPVNLNGLTVEAASERIKAKLAKIYSGMSSTNVDVSTNAKVTLGQIRTIQVNVMGEVDYPGTYHISSFSTAFHALYRAGGVSGIGSLRNIKVVRGGQTVSTIDVYDYILRGKSNSDIRLQEGDVVLVTPYECVVKIDGNVKRPMFYEMKKGESLKTLISYAGGFKDDAYSHSVSIERNDGMEKSVATVDEINYTEFKLKDGDAVNVGAILDRYTNRIQVKGAVYRPGFYELGNQISTVRELVAKADGPLEEAFLDHVILHRQKADRTLEVIPVDLKGILAGTAADVALAKNDVLYIPSKYDLESRGNVEIHGEVYSPGTFPFAENTKLEDLIIQAGGLKETASLVRIDVTRRIKDNKSTKKSKEISKIFTFGVKDGFVIDGEAGFVLEPYDKVYVRRSPGYSPQITVSVEGEVEFEGRFTLSERNERLSDVIAKAGGLSDYAYPKGAYLERTMTEDEYRQSKELLDIIKMQNRVEDDDVNVSTLDLSWNYKVAIDLEAALKNPHSDADLSLREGDKVYIPEYNNFVKIMGNVRRPNTVTYDPSKKLSYYLSEAGGCGEDAKKKGIFILYANGHVKEVGRSCKAKYIEPGSEIIVPSKHKTKWELSQTLSAVSSSVSMLAVIATLVTAIKR